MRLILNAVFTGWTFFGAALFSTVAVTPAIAEVVLDGSLGSTSSIPGPNYAITADLGKQVGGNLFHSFSRFNLETNGSAIFSGPVSVTNIISRVTGGASSIDGAISSTIQGANLYFVNPAGITFGPNARIDISGSFHATTADYLKLADGGRFDARSPAPENNLLTSASPSAFGFVTDTPAPISIESSRLAVSEGNTMSLIGGNITIANAADMPVLQAPGGRINLASVASTGEISLGPSGIDASAFDKMGAINITNTGGHDYITSAGDLTVTTVNPVMASGSIYLSGGKFVTDNSYIFSYTPFTIDNNKGIYITARDSVEIKNGSWIRTDTQSSGKAGAIEISAPVLTVGGGGGGSISASTSGSGNAGSIHLVVDTLNITGAGASVDAATYSDGKGGAIDIKAVDSVNITGGGGIWNTAFSGVGDAGTISIVTGKLNIKDAGSYVDASTHSVGKGGDITIKASDTVISDGGYISAATSGSGNAGSITIDSQNLTLQAGGLIATTAEKSSSGLGGNINITATGSVTVDGNNNKTSNNYSWINSDTYGQNNAGNITIGSSKLTVSNTGRITSESTGTGKSGDITIDTKDLSILTAGIISNDTFGSGGSGNILITALDSLTIDGYLTSNGSTGYSSINSGSGNGTTVSINSSNLSMDNFGQIRTVTTNAGNGASIDIHVNQISIANGAQVMTGSSSTGNAGSISIKADNVSLSSNSRLDSRASGVGNAGTISITANKLIMTDSSITTAATNSDGGNIRLNTTVADIRNSTVSTSVKGGRGNGGNIYFAAEQLVLNNSSVIANAWGGNGGNIFLNTGGLIQSPLSIISASSQFGIAGNIVISGAQLADMPQSIVDLTTLIAPKRCASTSEGISSFTVLECSGVFVPPDRPMTTP